MKRSACCIVVTLRAPGLTFIVLAQACIVTLLKIFVVINNHKFVPPPPQMPFQMKISVRTMWLWQVFVLTSFSRDPNFFAYIQMCTRLTRWTVDITAQRDYTGCHRRNGPNFRRVFLMLNYTDITQNTYVQSWTVTEIMAREVWKYDSCYTLIDHQIRIKTGRNMWFL